MIVKMFFLNNSLFYLHLKNFNIMFGSTEQPPRVITLPALKKSLKTAPVAFAQVKGIKKEPPFREAK